MLALIEESYLASGGVYGFRNVHRDLKEAGESVGKHRVERLMRAHGLRSVRSPQRYRYKTGKPSAVAPNKLQRQFTVPAPDQAWVTDITYLRTAEGWLYLAVVLDLFSRAVIGWSMKATPAPRTGARCTAHGNLAATSEDNSDDPLRPRRPVR